MTTEITPSVSAAALGIPSEFQHTPNKFHAAGRWSDSVCSCCDDCCSCVTACCCMPIPLAQLCVRVHKFVQNARKCCLLLSVGFFVIWLIIPVLFNILQGAIVARGVLAFYEVNGVKGEEDFSIKFSARPNSPDALWVQSQFALLGNLHFVQNFFAIGSFLLFFMIVCTIRRKIRQRDEIEGECGGCCGDFCCSLWCMPCTLCQLMRHEQMSYGKYNLCASDGKLRALPI